MSKPINVSNRSVKMMKILGLELSSSEDKQENNPSSDINRTMSSQNMNIPTAPIVTPASTSTEASAPVTLSTSEKHSSSSEEDIFSDDSDNDPNYKVSDEYLSDSDLSGSSLSDEDEDEIVPEWISITPNSNLITFPEFPETDQLLRSDIDVENPYDLFTMFLSSDILDLMVTETNRYANDKVSKGQLMKWSNTCAEEIKKFLSILMLMGIDRLPDIRLYWSNDDMFGNAFVKRIMSRDRFLTLLSNWHFENNQNDNGTNRIFKIQRLLDLFLNNFKSVIKPGKDLVVDESMIPWRGRLLFRQYIPLKSHKYGIKLYKLCLPTGYTYNCIVYCGKPAVSTRNIGHAHKIVLELIDGLMDEGRVVCGDNFYTSLPLVQELLQRKTFYCGTLRVNRKGIPIDFIKRKQKKGEVDSVVNQEGIKIVKWTDKRQVVMMFINKHKGEMIELNKKNRLGNAVRKPDCIVSYNKAKKGVDLSDQLAGYYCSVRKTIKWYRKIALELIFGTSVVNAWTMHSNFAACKRLSLLKFRTVIIKKLNGGEENILSNPILKKKKTTKPHKLEKSSGQVRAVRKRC